jgi:hypothetical protein
LNTAAAPVPLTVPRVATFTVSVLSGVGATRAQNSSNPHVSKMATTFTACLSRIRKYHV